MRRSIAQAILTLLTATLPAIAETSTYRVRAPSLRPDDRVLAFTIDVGCGRVASLPKCLPGWTITVDNEPNWHGRLDGQGIVGAAAIAPPTLSELFQLAPAPPDSCAMPQVRPSATVRLTILRGDGSIVSLPPTALPLLATVTGDR